MLYLRTKRFVSGMILGLALVICGLGFFAARLAAFPWWYKKDLVGRALPPCSEYEKRVYLYCEDPLKSLGLDYTSFEGAREMQGRSIRVTGWWIPARQASTPNVASKGTVILVHGAGMHRRAMLRHAAYLNKAGFDTLLIDCWNHGMTAGDDHGISFGLWESGSIAAAVDWAKRKALPGPISVFGTSQGGFAALRAAAYDPDIRGVIAENPYVSARRVLLEFPAFNWMPKSSKRIALFLLGLWMHESIYDLDAHQFAAQIRQPVLLIHGQNDKAVQLAQSQELLSLLPQPNKSLWVVPTGDHEALWNGNQKEYEARVILFLKSL